jgi:replicative DNA helicase
MITAKEAELFNASEDFEKMEAAVLATAIAGDAGCRGQLAMLFGGFEEPYRTIAATAVELVRSKAFWDRHVLQGALIGKPLSRRTADGQVTDLSAEEALNLVIASEPEPGQAAAYLPLLMAELRARRRAEFKEKALGLAQAHGDDPLRLKHEVDNLAAQARPDAQSQGNEATEFFPYFHELEQLQQGKAFTGLDSGFTRLNQVCNGLETGLFVIAARPSLGKTTFAWQVSQLVAWLNKVPVIFVSMEQSQLELRAKALARLGKLNSKHISRGGFRSSNPEDLVKLRQAGERYFEMAHLITIIEGDATTTIDYIAQVAAAKIAIAETDRCLVVVDYLQILPLEVSGASRVTTAKDRVDLHVSELRRLARQLDSPVLAISSENRAGYDSKHLGVFKESGAVEYSADLAAIMTADKNASSSVSDKYRVVDLNIVKNRNGETGVVKFKFYPERAEFVENGRDDLPAGWDE